MALTGTELAYVQPPTPSLVAVAGDYVVAFGEWDSSTPKKLPVYGVYTVTDLSAPSEASYQDSTAKSFGGAVAHSDGNVYVEAGDLSSPGYLCRVVPSTGTFTVMTSANTMSAPYLSCTDYVVGRQAKLHVATSVVSSFSNGAGTMGNVGDRIFAANGTTLRELSLPAGTVVNTWTLPAAVTNDSSYRKARKAARIGTKLYFPTTDTGRTYVGIDTTTDTILDMAATPAGFPAWSAGAFSWPGGYVGPISDSWTAGPDGNLYRLHGPNTLVITDPATGRWVSETLPTSRTRRYQIVAHGSKMYLSTGEPIN